MTSAIAESLESVLSLWENVRDLWKAVETLQAQNKILQDLVVSQDKRIKELEEDIRPTPKPPTLKELQTLAIALQDSHNALRNQVQRMDTQDEPAFIKLLSGLSLTPSPSSPKTRMDKRGKRGKNNQ